jgi:hypothetical protein
MPVAAIPVVKMIDQVVSGCVIPVATESASKTTVPGTKIMTVKRCPSAAPTNTLTTASTSITQRSQAFNASV